MFISVKDLELLIHLENKLGSIESWSDDVVALWQLIEKLQQQRKTQNEKTRILIANKRKSNPKYAR